MIYGELVSPMFLKLQMSFLMLFLFPCKKDAALCFLFFFFFSLFSLNSFQLVVNNSKQNKKKKSRRIIPQQKGQHQQIFKGKNRIGSF